MTHNGRDHWNQQDAEQRARLLRDMPLIPMHDPHKGRYTRRFEAALLMLLVFAITVFLVSR